MPTIIPAAGRTLAVFEVFAREKKELSNSEMARALQLADSSCSDLLHTLHGLGYLMRTSRSRRFYPTGRLLETARQISENDPLTTVAQEAVEQLLEKTNETSFFGVMDRGLGKLAAVQPSRQPLRYILETGQRVSLHGSALGKSLLGVMPRDEVTELLKERKLRPFTDKTITDRKRLLADVDSGKARGWYEAIGEGAEGVSALAVSGLVNEQPVGISIAGPTERVERNRKAYLAALKEVRDALLAPHH